MRIFRAIYIYVLTLILVSCGSKDELSKMLDIKYIPFQGSQGGKWGFLDTEGNKVIDTVFETQPTYFKEGYALVRKPDGYLFFINEKGEITGPKVIDATLFHEGLACVVRENEAPEFINAEFKTVFKLGDAVFAGTFSDGLAKFQDKAGKWGYVDKEGKVAIKPQFDFVSSFKQGLARVHMLSGDKSTSWVIDKTGAKVFDLPDDVMTLGYYNDNVSVFNDSTGWGVFDNKGAKIISGKKDWEMLGDFFNGYASFLKGDKWGAINTKGEIAVEPKYENNLIFVNGVSAVSSNGKWGFMEPDGNMKIDFQFDGIYIPFFAKTALVKKGSEILFVDGSGNKVNKGGFPIFNVSLEYDELLNVDKYLQTDVFDIKSLADTLIGQLTVLTVNGMGGYSDFAFVQNFVKARGLKYVLSEQSLTVPQAKFGMVTYSYIFDFSKPIADKESRFRSMEVSVYFPQAMTRKIDIIYNALKSIITKAGFTQDKEDKASFLSSSETSTAAILRMPSQLVFSFVLKDKHLQDIAEKERQ